MTQLISIAIETSCRHGGVALGIGERLADKIDFDAGSRHATHLVIRLRELLGRHGLRAAQVNDLRDIVRDNTANKTTYPSLSVRAKSPSQVETLEASIKAMGFAAFSLLDASKSLRTFFSVFDLLLGIFGSLALAVATLGIVNTLVMAILERRREIGVLKALGAADSDVQQLFFVEAGVMGLFGGFLGVLFGWLLGRAITFGTNVYLKRQNLNPIELSSVPWWLVIAAIVFAILVSLAAGLYPASRAAKLNPVDALRYE